MVSFTPQPCYPCRNNPWYHRIAGWVSPRASVDAAEKRKMSIPNSMKKGKIVLKGYIVPNKNI
jgi:hypothetical protein